MFTDERKRLKRAGRWKRRYFLFLFLTFVSLYLALANIPIRSSVAQDVPENFYIYIIFRINIEHFFSRKALLDLYLYIFFVSDVKYILFAKNSIK